MRGTRTRSAVACSGPRARRQAPRRPRSRARLTGHRQARPRINDVCYTELEDATPLKPTDSDWGILFTGALEGDVIAGRITQDPRPGPAGPRRRPDVRGPSPPMARPRPHVPAVDRAQRGSDRGPESARLCKGVQLEGVPAAELERVTSSELGRVPAEEPALVPLPRAVTAADAAIAVLERRAGKGRA
jgi:hypothetical protein